MVKSANPCTAIWLSSPQRVIQQPFGLSTALIWMELESTRPVKCSKYDNTWSPCDSYNVALPITGSSIVTFHDTYYCPSFPLWLISPKWFWTQCQCSWWCVWKNKHLFKVMMTLTEKRKGSLWNPIIQRYFILSAVLAHQQRSNSFQQLLLH